jgi:hypothetical protein
LGFELDSRDDYLALFYVLSCVASYSKKRATHPHGQAAPTNKQSILTKYATTVATQPIYRQMKIGILISSLSNQLVKVI